MSRSPPRVGTGWLSTVVVSLALVTSMALAGVGGAAAAAPAAASGDAADLATQDDADNETLSPADEIFVRENGDVVLRYESDAEDLTSGRYSVDVSAGLLHALVATETEGDFQGTASASAVLEQSRLAANGSLAVQRPESLESLDLQVQGTSTTEESSFDATLSAAVATDAAPSTQLVESASTSGRLVTTGTALVTSGRAELESTSPLGRPQFRSYTLVESGETYTLTAEEDYVVSERQRPRWNTSERAERTLRALYGTVAEQLGGDVAVTVESHSFQPASEGQGYRLQIAYTVEYTGIDQGVTRIVSEELAASEQVDLSESEAAAVADRIAKLQLDHASVTVDLNAESATANWSVRLENYNEVSLAVADLIEAYDPGDAPDSDEEALSSVLPDPQTIRDRVEARRSTNLTQRLTWSAELAQPDAQRTTVDAEVHLDTENRAAYVDAIQETGATVTNVSFELDAATEGEEVTASAALEMDRERMLAEGVNALLNASEAEGMDPRTRQALEAFKRAELQRAKMDFSLEDGTGRIEFGAKFDDLSAFRDVVAAGGEAPAVTGVAGTVEDGTTDSYVYVEGAVSSDADESEVRELSYVDDDTVVHLPGTYNRSFPTPNTADARDYLGLPSPTPTEPGDDGDGTSGITPGFGPLVALGALAVVALLARRRGAA